MDKYKWIRVSPMPSRKELVENLIKFSFFEGSDYGFVIDKANDEVVKARYIEKIIYVDTVEDPYGNKIEQNILSFRFISFQVFLNDDVIEIVNPDVKIIRGFYSLLAQANNFSIKIESILFDPYEWSLRLMEMSNSKYYIEQVDFDPVLVGDFVTIKLSALGKGNVMEECEKILKVKHPPVKRIKLKSRFFKGVFVEVKSTGLVSISSRFNEPDYMLVRSISIA